VSSVLFGDWKGPEHCKLTDFTDTKLKNVLAKKIKVGHDMWVVALEELHPIRFK
jgi:hypothetical protein